MSSRLHYSCMTRSCLIFCGFLWNFALYTMIYTDYANFKTLFLCFKSLQIENAHHTLIVYISFYGYMLCRCPNKQIILLKVRYMLTCASGYIVHVQYCSLPFNRPLPPKATPLIRYSTIHWDCEILLNFPLYPLKRGHPSYNMYIPVNLWELLGGDLPLLTHLRGRFCASPLNAQNCTL